MHPLARVGSAWLGVVALAACGESFLSGDGATGSTATTSSATATGAGGGSTSGSSSGGGGAGTVTGGPTGGAGGGSTSVTSNGGAGAGTVTGGPSGGAGGAGGQVVTSAGGAGGGSVYSLSLAGKNLVVTVWSPLTSATSSFTVKAAVPLGEWHTAALELGATKDLACYFDGSKKGTIDLGAPPAFAGMQAKISAGIVQAPTPGADVTVLTDDLALLVTSN